MVKHRLDLESWSVIPLNLGMATAPLYDHLPAPQLTTIIVAILAVNWLWIRWSKPRIEERVGVFRANWCANRTFSKRPWSLSVCVWATFLTVTAFFAFLNSGRHFYHGNGWIERTSGTWLCLTIVYCLYRALDRTNYRPRRLWYGIAALQLTVSFYFLATSPASFAINLVLIGTTGIVLGLLDLRLLFHFASTPVADGGDGMNTVVIDKEDMHG